MQRRPIELLEQSAPGSALSAHRPVVQLADQLTIAWFSSASEKNRRLRRRQDPALHHLYPDLDFGLVARLVRTCRDHRGASAAMSA
jgi:hypothetical protein